MHGNNATFPPRVCPICYSATSTLLFTQCFAKIEGVSFLDGYDVVSCKQCGFVYASGIPEQSAFDAYYTNANKYELDIEQPDAITGKYDHILREIIHLCDDKAMLVADVGCARSEILRLLQTDGFTNLTGIDPSLKNVEYLKSKGINAVHATIQTIDTSKQYDVVIFLMVLEHIRDLRSTVDTLRAITAENSLLVVSVPDMATPAPRELPYQEFSREHINFFTEVSLSNLMKRHGFHAVSIKKERGELIGAFRKVSGSEQITKDEAGERCIQHYIERSKMYEDEIHAKLSMHFETPIIIWGLGTFTQRLLEKAAFKNIVALVDSTPQYTGKKYKDITLLSPRELIVAGGGGYHEPILIATSHRYIGAIERTIRDVLKLNNELIKLHNDYSFVYALDVNERRT